MLHFFAKRFEDLQGAKRDERGFTLIELLVVVIIIGVLAAIAIPTFIAQRERAQNASVTSDLRNAATAAQTYATGQGGDYTGLDVTALENNDAQLSDGNIWGSTINGTADEFLITIDGANGSGTYDSDAEPQLTPVPVTP